MIDNITKKCAKLCVESYKTCTYNNDDTDTQVLFKDGVLAFRGTTDLKDWKTNLKLDYGYFHNLAVHKGFLDAYKSVRSYLPEVNIVTGHSLGGSLAVLYGLDRLLVGQNIRIITFGQPRVISNYSCEELKKFDNNLERFINNNDIVSRIPTKLMGYSHFGQLNYFDRNGKYFNKISFLNILRDRFRGLFLDIFDYDIDCVGDHNMEIYYNLVNKALNE